MKNKITLLIIASVVGLVSLSVVQTYLINNTYQLRKEAFIEDMSESVSFIDDHLTKIDSIRSVWRDDLIEITAEFKKGKIERDAILEQFREKTIAMNPGFLSVLRTELKENEINSPIQFQKRVRSIVILDSIKNDTLYAGNLNGTSYILGDDFDDKEYKLGQSTSYSEYTFNTIRDGNEVSEMMRMNFETETIMSIEGWENEVLLQMKGLLLISASIFLFVFGVLFYSIKNLITQKKIAEVKTDFINNISHEFKTPLATLTLATGILKTKGARQSDTIKIIERQNHKLQKLLDQVLDNSLSYNEIKLNKELVNIEDFLSTLLDDFELAMLNENAEISRNFTLNEKKASIDRFYLSTALSNMLDNAVKYNESVVKIQFQASASGSLRIVIEDNGIGISEREQKSLFEKFYRVGNNETHEVKGLGLGLYYANQIVIAHGGKIEVKSKVNQGSSFIVELPLTQS
ncbi:sensor histidine kinase [Ekhidna sp.]